MAICTVVWFRRDLRIEDNPALIAAARAGVVVPVFVWSPEEEGQFYPGRVSRWWLKQSLIHLDATLSALGVRLIMRRARNTFSALTEIMQATGATQLFYNHLYDPVSLVRDHKVKQGMCQRGIAVQSFNADLLYEPWEVYDEQGQAYTTFDAFWNKCMDMPFEPDLPLPAPKRLSGPAALASLPSLSADQLGLEDKQEKASNALLARAWVPGWNNAERALIAFLSGPLLEYLPSSSKADCAATSLLSPHMHFGEISVRKVFFEGRRTEAAWRADGLPAVAVASISHFLRSVGFREYSRYLSFNFPFTHERSLLSNLKSFPWRVDEAAFKAWRQGRTGYPLVDAGMREMWATGWIHNRIRVVVSSFFVKFLQLPWRWGMKYFWDSLLDADLECDVLGWQYISGSLPDGHELDRMDNPEIEGYKYDPDGEYVRRWIPELSRVPCEWIHHPWDAPPEVLAHAGVELGCNYPLPIVDVTTARQRLQDALTEMWQREAAAKAAEANGVEEGEGETAGVVVNYVDREEAERERAVVAVDRMVGSEAMRMLLPRVVISSAQHLQHQQLQQVQQRGVQQHEETESEEAAQVLQPTAVGRLERVSSLSSRRDQMVPSIAAPGKLTQEAARVILHGRVRRGGSRSRQPSVSGEQGQEEQPLLLMPSGRGGLDEEVTYGRDAEEAEALGVQPELPGEWEEDGAGPAPLVELELFPSSFVPAHTAVAAGEVGGHGGGSAIGVEQEQQLVVVAQEQDQMAVVQLPSGRRRPLVATNSTAESCTVPHAGQHSLGVVPALRVRRSGSSETLALEDKVEQVQAKRARGEGAAAAGRGGAVLAGHLQQQDAEVLLLAGPSGWKAGTAAADAGTGPKSRGGGTAAAAAATAVPEAEGNEANHGTPGEKVWRGQRGHVAGPSSAAAPGGLFAPCGSMQGGGGGGEPAGAAGQGVGCFEGPVPEGGSGGFSQFFAAMVRPPAAEDPRTQQQLLQQQQQHHAALLYQLQQQVQVQGHTLSPAHFPFLLQQFQTLARPALMSNNGFMAPPLGIAPLATTASAPGADQAEAAMDPTQQQLLQATKRARLEGGGNPKPFGSVPI